MSALDEAVRGLDALSPHVLAVALISARLLPAAFLCPLLGGSHAPTTVKLGAVLSLASSLHFAAGVAPQAQLTTSFDFAAAALKELMFGTSLGLVAALPFDAARLGGRFIDLFRGSSAEAALPLTGTKEAATGELLSHLLLALASLGVAGPLIVSALWRSFALVPLSGFTHTESVALQVAGLVGSTFATGLALGAPIAAASLAVDATLGLASRAAPQLNLQEVGAPLRILGGGALLWLCLGILANRLVVFAAATPDALRAVMEAGR